MGIQILSKTTTGSILTLFLVVLLSQSNIFNFLIDTVFGRTILIFFILGISYAHKFLGMFAALLIILVLNHNDLSYFEGFDKNDTQTSDTSNIKKYTGKNIPVSEQKDASNSSSNSKITDSVKKPSGKITAKEGFNTVERETTMLRGKNSKEIPVYNNNSDKNGDDVQPSDRESFKNGYSNI